LSVAGQRFTSQIIKIISILSYLEAKYTPMLKNQPATLHITLLRHGRSQANELNVLQGQMDSPLSSEGIHQSQLLGEYWHSQGKEFDQIICSPLGRAHETARIISELLSTPIELDDRWMEREFGKAEGLLFDDVFSKYSEYPRRSIYEPAYESGESDWDLYIRAADAVQGLMHKPAGQYLVVSHGSIINFALFTMFGITPQPSSHRLRFRFNNTGFAEFEYNTEDQNWTIWSLNCTSHLDNLYKNDS